MPRDGDEIGPSAKKVRRGAVNESKPIADSPLAQNDAPATRRRRRANAVSEPVIGSPSASTASDGVGDGQSSIGAHTRFAIPELIAQLKLKQTIRRHCTTTISKLERSTDDLIATVLRLDPALAEKPKKALADASAKVRRQFEAQIKIGIASPIEWPDTPTSQTLDGMAKVILASLMQVPQFVALRDVIEGEMEKIAAQFPVEPWRKGVRGLGLKGMAIIAAESGIPIGDWRSVDGFRKHMALSVENGRAQRLPEKVAPADVGKAYSKRRRSELWQIADSLFKAQWRGARDEDGADPTKTGKPIATPAHAVGPYGEAYASRKAHTLPRIAATADLPDKIGGYRNPAKWTPGRCDADARRIMTKALLRDLWVEWRRATA